MADLATLGLAVDSGPVKRASADLDKFASSAGRAGGAADQFGKSTAGAFAPTVVSAKDFSAALKQTGADLTKITPAMVGISATAGGVATALAATGGAAQHMGQEVEEAAILSTQKAAHVAHAFEQLVATGVMGELSFHNLSRSALQLSHALGESEGGVAGAGKILKNTLISLVTNPVNLTILGFTAIAGAAGLVFSLIEARSHRAEEALKTHADLVDRIKKAYEDAGDATKAFSGESLRVLQALDEEQRRVAQEALNRQASSLLKEQQGGMPGEFFMLSDATRDALFELDKEAQDGVADWKRFGDSLVDALSDPRIDTSQRKIVQGLLEIAAAASKTQLSLRPAAIAAPGPMTPQLPTRQESLIETLEQRAQVERIKRGMEADLIAISARSPADLGAAASLRERISLTGEAISAEEREARIAAAGAVARANAENSLSEAQRGRMLALDESIRAGQLEITVIGKSAAETERLRMENQLLADLRRDAAENGIAIDEREVEAIKAKSAEMGKLVELQQRLTLMNDSSFERSQLFRSPIDQQIAGQLREIYGDAFIAHMSDFEAQQIRINARLSELNDLGSDVVHGALHDFIDGLREGQNAFDTLADVGINALSKIEDKLVDVVSDQLWQGLFARLLGGFGGGALSPGAAGLFGAGLFHKGGRAGSATSSRLVSASAFIGARRMHSGGLAGDEVPIIAKRGEEFGWPSQMRDKYGGRTNVNVHNYGSDIETKESVDANGIEQFDIYVRSRARQEAFGALAAAQPPGVLRRGT